MPIPAGGALNKPSGTLVNPYDYGDCTWYIKQRYPNLYGYLGNAGTWGASGRKQGYQFLSTPAADTVAVWRPTATNGVSAAGHVAVVNSVNGDGSITVSEMNWAGWNHVDTRILPPSGDGRWGDGLVGFMVPPGSSYGQTVTPCVSQLNGPFGWSFCTDGIVGGAALAAGGVIMLASFGVLLIAAANKSGITQGVARVLPMGKELSAAIPQKQARTEVQDAQAAKAENQQMVAAQRSKSRVTRARARVQVSDEERERQAERSYQARTGRRAEPGMVKRGVATDAEEATVVA